MEYEKLIKEINKELRFLKGEIGVGNENGKDTYYLYINGELILKTSSFLKMIKQAMIYLAD